MIETIAISVAITLGIVGIFAYLFYRGMVQLGEDAVDSVLKNKKEDKYN